MKRVSVFVDSEADALAPGARTALVEIETTDGRVLTHRALTRKGDPENPLTDAELEDKYHELTRPVLGPKVADALLVELALPVGHHERRDAVAEQVHRDPHGVHDPVRAEHQRDKSPDAQIACLEHDSLPLAGHQYQTAAPLLTSS
jgi:hypothetical protein